MHEILIREATLLDLDALYQCEQAIISAERPYDRTLKPDVIRYYNIERMLEVSHVHFLVATSQEQEVIGCGFARIEAAKNYVRHSEHAYLGLMYVDPRYRGEGINGRIIMALQAWCRERNVAELRLDVYDGNSGALRAYEKMGFVKHMVEMRMNSDLDEDTRGTG